LLSGCSFFKSDFAPNSRELALKNYRHGARALKDNDLVQAEIDFHTTLEYQANFAPAFEGLAQILFKKNKIIQAEHYLDLAIQSDKKWIPAYILKGRIYLQKEDFDLALEELNLANNLASNHNLLSLSKEIEPLLADAYSGIGDFYQAHQHYQKAVKNFPQEKHLQIKMMQTAAYVKMLQNKGEQVNGIMAKEVITRADLAVLLLNYLIPDRVNQDTLNFTIKDLPESATQREAILKCVHLKYLSLLPDGTFRPSDRVDRAEMALFIQQILKMQFSDFGSANLLIISDIEPWQSYARAASLVVKLNIMRLDEDGGFVAQNLIPGTKALQIVLRLATVLKFSSFPMHLLRQESPNTEHD